MLVDLFFFLISFQLVAHNSRPSFLPSFLFFKENFSTKTATNQTDWHLPFFNISLWYAPNFPQQTDSSLSADSTFLSSTHVIYFFQIFSLFFRCIFLSKDTSRIWKPPTESSSFFLSGQTNLVSSFIFTRVTTHVISFHRPDSELHFFWLTKTCQNRIW